MGNLCYCKQFPIRHDGSAKLYLFTDYMFFSYLSPSKIKFVTHYTFVKKWVFDRQDTTLHKVLSESLPLLCILPSNNPYICPPIYLALYFNKCMYVTRLNICNMMRWWVVRLKYLAKSLTAWRTFTTILHVSSLMILFRRFKQVHQLKSALIQIVSVYSALQQRMYAKSLKMALQAKRFKLCVNEKTTRILLHLNNEGSRRLFLQ